MTNTVKTKIVRVSKRSGLTFFDKRKAYFFPLLLACILSVLFLLIVGRKNPFTAI